MSENWKEPVNEVGLKTDRSVVGEAAHNVPDRTLSVRSCGVPQGSVIVPLSLNVVAMKVPMTRGMLRILNFQQGGWGNGERSPALRPLRAQSHDIKNRICH